MAEQQHDDGWWLKPPESQQCRSVHLFERLEQIGEGTYGRVYMARNKESSEVVALKKVRMRDEKEGFPVTALREIHILQELKHPNIVRLLEVVSDSKSDAIFLVMEYAEHDLAGLIDHKKTPFADSEVKCILQQLLRAVAHMHQHWFLHRDIKMSNLLYDNRGQVKLADFGLAREFGSPLQLYTTKVVTLWYRAPELLLGPTEYSTAIDLWSVGCVFGELLKHAPLIAGKSELHQIELIFKLLGSPNEKIWPAYPTLPGAKDVCIPFQPYNNLEHRLPEGVGREALDLLHQLLTYNPSQRPAAKDALKHAYFHVKPPPQPLPLMPTFPELRGAQYRRRRRDEPNGEAESFAHSPEAAADPRAAADPKRRKSSSALLSAPKPNYSMRNVGDVF